MGYSVCVYAICKDEAAFARRWYDSMSEADWVAVLDTGSTDGTPGLLRALGAIVQEERIEPWRFDTARNRSMRLIPTEADICVCTDLDEVFRPGWRKALEAAWGDGVVRARYRFTWNFMPDGSEGTVYYADKIHARSGFRWVYPAHEVLVYEGAGGREVTAAGVQLDHRADESKSRGQYLSLLELGVRENPCDARCLHYLGREYMLRGMWEQCEETLLRHVALPGGWPEERSASMRFLARACAALGRGEDELRWLYRAAGEAPWLREPYVELARRMYIDSEWDGLAFFAARALAVTDRGARYICEADAWGAEPYDLAALGLYHTGRYSAAADMAAKALALSPKDARLAENLRLIRAKADEA